MSPRPRWWANANAPHDRGRAARRRRFWRATASGLVALLGLALLALGPAALAQSWHTLSDIRAGQVARPGQAVQDGSITFVVHHVQCTPDGLELQPRNGHFCLVTLTARNDGETPVTVRERDQRLHGAAGARYQPDTKVTPLANPDGNPFGKLEPGAEVTGVVAFDVPATATITHVEVHADPYTRGVPVRVPR